MATKTKNGMAKVKKLVVELHPRELDLLVKFGHEYRHFRYSNWRKVTMWVFWSAFLVVMLFVFGTTIVWALSYLPPTEELPLVL